MAARKPEKDRLILAFTCAQMAAFTAKLKRRGDCLLYPQVNADGYGRHYVKRIAFLAHRIVVVRALLRSPEEPLVRHKCRARNCCELTHLELGSVKQNVHDRYRDGTMKAPRAGERHPWSKYTREQVRAVYSAYAKGGTTYEEAGRAYGMGVSYVEALVKRKIWREALVDLPLIAFDSQAANKVRGGAVHLAKLTEEDVRAIREALRGGGGLAECKRLAVFYGVSWSNIYAIKNRATWRHVP